jgi:N6-L-threonylcarbamoyladenine synthase
MMVLGIETSCDDTCAAIVGDGTRVLSDVVSSQADVHAAFGGVVPEVASRRHIEAISVIVDAALTQAGVRLGDVEAIGVTQGPGLLGSLVVGIAAAKALAVAIGRPIVAVDHLESHIYANFLGPDPPPFPFLALVVSGGHSDLVLAEGHGRFTIVGRTRDDAAGEAFDKAARILGMGYPGGPAIEQLAKRGDENAVTFPVADLGGALEFSFSGVKSELARTVARGGGADPADLAASYQKAIVTPLVDITVEAARRFGISRIALAGGVAANERLRTELTRRAADEGIGVILPDQAYCMDNAAMVASCAYFTLEAVGPSRLDFDAYATFRPTTESLKGARPSNR